MKEKKELTIGKATTFIILLYSVFTIILGIVYIGLMILVRSYIPTMIATIISVIASILMMYLAWRFSIKCVFKNRSTDGLNTKSITKYLIIFVTVIGLISMGYDIYDKKQEIDSRYSNDFVNNQNVIAEFSQEELQEKVKENNELADMERKQFYPYIIAQNILAIFINIIVITLVPKKMLEKYDGIANIEKETENK